MIRYCKVTLNDFFSKKKEYLIDLLCQIEILLLSIFYLLKIPGFLFKFKVFSCLKNLNFQVFLRVPGKVITLMIF